MKRLFVRAPVALGLLFLLAQVHCAGQSQENGTNCKSLCEKGKKECEAAKNVDCDSQCLFEDARAETTGCRKHVDAVSKCSAALEDICVTANECKEELTDFWACVVDWCMDHPGSQYCAMPPDNG